ncbi:MAG: ABC transporter ATP-binding protein [Hyphomicrobiaceae bacterium]
MSAAAGLELDDVTVARGGKLIVSGVTLSIATGRIVAVIGPNGAGKSTLLAAIAGQLPHRGRIHWQGAPPSPGQVGYFPQSADVRSSLTVLETVLLGRYDRLGWHVGDADLARAGEALAELELNHLAPRPMSTLSGGQRQLVLLAQSLVRQPALLVLDEATSALDLRHQMSVLRRLSAYVERTGALVVTAIHDLNLAARFADSMLLMANGRLQALGTPREVLTGEALASSFGIRAEMLLSSAGEPVLVPLAPL